MGNASILITKPYRKIEKRKKNKLDTFIMIHEQQKQEKSKSKKNFECKNKSQAKGKQFMLILHKSITIIRNSRLECKTKRIIAQSNKEHKNAVHKLHFMGTLIRSFVRSHARSLTSHKYTNTQVCILYTFLHASFK